MSEYKRMVGDRVGHNWRMLNIRGKRAVRHVVFDTNYWKSFVASRLLTPMGDRGNLSLWGRETERHMLFAEHLTAEYRVKTEGRGRKVDEWKMRPEAHDNHWFEGVVGAAPCGPSGSLRSGDPMPSARAHLDSALKIFLTPSASRSPHHAQAAATPTAFQFSGAAVASNKAVSNLIIV